VEVQAPPHILQQEVRLLQQSVAALVDNGRLPEPQRDNEGRVMRSLSDALAGKMRALNERDRQRPGAKRLLVRVDSPLDRGSRLQEIMGGESIAAAGTAKSAWSLILRLRCLGLTVSFEDQAGRQIPLWVVPPALRNPAGDKEQ
jgi:hypothetical protein